MISTLQASARVDATVIEVLPSMGLAWVLDDEMREWALTRSMPGVQLENLEPGAKVCLHVKTLDGKPYPCGCN
jgi:hypothetical protein